MTNDEIWELKGKLRDCERERDRISYLLVQAQDEVVGLEESLQSCRAKVEQGKNQIETIREKLAACLNKEGGEVMELLEQVCEYARAGNQVFEFIEDGQKKDDA